MVRHINCYHGSDISEENKVSKLSIKQSKKGICWTRKNEKLRLSETSVASHKFAWCNIPEDLNSKHLILSLTHTVALQSVISN
jgi:hypothetical protein